MTSKIKVDNIENQCGGAVVTKCGGTTTIAGTNVNATTVTATNVVGSTAVKSNAIQASDGGNLVSQSGTTITLGASGDNIVLAGGATQSGFGRTGTVNWVTTVKTTGFTAVSGEGYFCNTAGGAFTVTLPSSPSAGDIVAVSDYAATFDTANLTLGRNSSNIGGQALDSILSTEGIAVTLVFIDATKGWIVTDSGLQSNAPGPKYVAATGGTITTIGDFKVHAFTGPGTFCVSCAGNSAGSTGVSNFLVVAGGGGGGRADIGGGGGAGGLRNLSCVSITAQGYPIVVGGGGAQQPAFGQGNNGSNSTGISITSTGGGGGGGSAPPYVAEPGSPGGSGGGGGNAGGSGGSGNTPPVSPPQGNDGALGAGGTPTQPGVGGGGGGASAAASPVPGGPPVGGIGGAGLDVSPFFGASPQPFYQANETDRGVTVGGQFAGGGGGAGDGPGGANGGPGGVGGGGKGSSPGNSAGYAGTVNSGGGGGGGENTRAQGGAGGSGIVLIKYKFQN